MKTSCIVFALLVSTMAGAQAQVAGNSVQATANQPALPAPTAYSAVELGANHRVWERTVYEPGPKGTVVPKKHRYTELASGLNFKDPQTGKWQPSKEEIDILPNGGAAATRGAHQVYFPGDIAQGVIELVTPDGRQLQSRPVALAYDDGKQTVLFAILTNSVGELTAPNEVTYPNAFEGASLRYTYTKAGFEQDVIVQSQLPAPDSNSFGLNAATAKLLVITEFFDTNNPVETPLPVNPTDGLSDTTLTFGTMMKMVGGRAFSIGTSDQSTAPTGGTPTYKSWVRLNGRKFLIEQVSYPRIAPQLQQLPMTGRVNSLGTNRLAGNSILDKGSAGLLLPPSRGLKSETGDRKSEMIRQLARTDWGQTRGLVLDYTTLNSSLTNYVFQGDTTYFVTGTVYLFGTTTIEGGAVVKYDKNYNNPGLAFYYGTVNCLAASYHPAVFTAKDDNSVGEGISGSTGSPVGYYAYTALTVYYPPSPVDLHDLRISYATRGIYIGANSIGGKIRDSQICWVNNAFFLFTAGSCAVENTLVYHTASAAIYSIYTTIAAVQLTIDQANCVFQPGLSSVYLTNCLLVQVTNSGTAYTSVNNATNSSSATVFQTVGAASHYLAANSPYTNAGTANIDPELLADLANKTTYPPIVYSNQTVSANTTFSPQAQRDTDLPDLGYHYDPLDYVFGGLRVTNATVTINPGTAIGIARIGDSEGIGLVNGAQFASQGLANNPNYIVCFNTVQEQAVNSANWTRPWYGFIWDAGAGLSLNSNCRFTDWSVMAQDSYFFNLYANETVYFQDCEFHGGKMVTYSPTVNFTNCLLERVYADLEPGDNNTPVIRNCLFWHGTFGFSPWTSTGNAIVADNLFDQTIIPDWMGGATYSGGHNAYVTNCNTMNPTKTGDVILASPPTYQSSWFGNYYQPPNSPLINTGSTTADQVGLYHYTTQTNQTPEATSQVDIGYHYVVTDAYGNPLDIDGDGVPDYLEDTNGNGVYDAGDLGDWLISLYNGLSRANGLLVFTPLK